MSAHHIPADGDLIHDSDRDTSEARTPTPEQAEVLALMELGGGRGLQRLSVSTWRVVDRLAAVLTTARSAMPNASTVTDTTTTTTKETNDAR